MTNLVRTIRLDTTKAFDFFFESLYLFFYIHGSAAFCFHSPGKEMKIGKTGNSREIGSNFTELPCAFSLLPLLLKHIVGGYEG